MGTLAYRPGPGRDLRLDWLRGFCLLAVIVNHIGGPSVFTLMTGESKFLVSAAEGFFFISGLVMGIVYRKRILRDGWASAIEQIFRRLGVLYVATVALTISFIVLHRHTDLPLWVDQGYGLGVDRLSHAIVGAFTLHYSYNGTDVLMNYVFLMLVTPLALYLLATGRTQRLMAGSVLLWAIQQFEPEVAMVPWPIVNAGNFPLAAWQLLFIAGLALGYHRDAVERAFRRRSARWLTTLLGAATLGLLALPSLVTIDLVAMLTAARLSYDPVTLLFHKPFLGPGRLLAFFVMAAFAYLLVTYFWKPIDGATGWLLLPLGQQALLAYGAHLFLIGFAYVLVPWTYGGGVELYLENSFRHAVALSIIWLLVRWLPEVWQRVAATPTTFRSQVLSARR